ncbi:MAG: hypothetical protein QOE80_805 [Actinomycetota bacterium]|nr:hypothetical protein [Actinomycetota bacterium]
MTATDESVVTRFNPLDPQLISDPYPIYARYRELDPIHWGIASNPALPGSWFLFRYAENAAVLIDTATFASNPETVGMQSAVPAAFAPVTAIFHRWLGAIDPPDHAKLRSIMSKAFTPRRVAALRPRIELIAATLLDEALARGDGRLDIIGDLSFPLPMTVVGDALGVPQGDWAHFRQWSEDLSKAVDSPGDEVAAAAGAAGIQGMFDYFKELAADRRRQGVDGADDLLGAMIAAADDDGQRMNEWDMLAICTELAVAGHETTTNAVAKGIIGLMDQRDRWDELRADPDNLLDGAVEEILRWTAPVQRQRWRWATRDVELDGRRIERGQSVVSILAAANRDPAEFPDPDRIDFTRPRGGHLTFGYGPHFCLGAALARLELRVSLNVLLDRLPDMELEAPEAIPWRPNHVLPGPAAVWVKP